MISREKSAPFTTTWNSNQANGKNKQKTKYIYASAVLHGALIEHIYINLLIMGSTTQPVKTTT